MENTLSQGTEDVGVDKKTNASERSLKGLVSL